jgi:Putative transposase/Transposase zinc-binding domain
VVDPRIYPSKANVELADVVRRFGPQYTARYGHRMMPSQKKALADIAACCTPELGGRLYRCDDCDETFWHYHCCRNRACPKCHGTQTRDWLKERQAELLPCDYFHAVVTVPSELRAVFQRHQKLLYGLLMQVSAAAIKDLCAEKRHLGALPGILSVLHTWNGQLGYHPHVHMLITGGGITADGQHWEPARAKFLVPVAALSRKIAAQFREALEAAEPAVFAKIPPQVWHRKWVSFCKHYGQGNDAVLGYLSRYVFRTAISNARILDMDQTHVTFRWKDRKADAWHVERLPGEEFLRRFLQHVLPRGFHKVRYYGLWHPSKRDQSNRAWLLLMLETSAEDAQPLKISSLVEALGDLMEPADRTAEDASDHELAPRCPHCGSCRTSLLGEYPRFGVP